MGSRSRLYIIKVTEHEDVDVEEGIDVKYLFYCFFNHVFGSGLEWKY